MQVNEVYNIISDNLKYYRMNNFKMGYLTQEQLSRLSMVSLSVIRNIEAKRIKQIISLNVLCNIARTLDIPLYKFFIPREANKPKI